MLDVGHLITIEVTDDAVEVKDRGPNHGGERRLHGVRLHVPSLLEHRARGVRYVLSMSSWDGPSRRTPGVGDVLASCAFLATSILVALLGIAGNWVTVGLLTSSSGPRALCPAEGAALFGFPVLVAIIVIGCSVGVVLRRRQRLYAWPLAFTTLGLLAVAYGLSTLAAIVSAQTICGP